MPGTCLTLATPLLLAAMLIYGCAGEPRPDDRPTIYGPWRWVGSFGGIAGIRPTPDAEGYERTFYFHRNGSVSIFGGDTLRARIGYRAAPVRPADDAPPRPGLHYADPLAAFPFDPGVDRHVLRRVGPDTLILADPCCHRYEHAFVRID